MEDYYDISKIKTGDIIISFASEIASLIVRFYTSSDVSHVALAIWVKKDLRNLELSYDNSDKDSELFILDFVRRKKEKKTLKLTPFFKALDRSVMYKIRHFKDKYTSDPNYLKYCKEFILHSLGIKLGSWSQLTFYNVLTGKKVFNTPYDNEPYIYMKGDNDINNISYNGMKNKQDIFGVLSTERNVQLTCSESVAFFCNYITYRIKGKRYIEPSITSPTTFCSIGEKNIISKFLEDEEIVVYNKYNELNETCSSIICIIIIFCCIITSFLMLLYKIFSRLLR